MDPLMVGALATLVKASQPMATPVAKQAAWLLGKLLGPGADALGARLGEFLTPPTPVTPTVLDAIAMWRHGNMTLLLARTAEVIEERSVEPRPVPIAVLFPLLEAASLVDDVDLREMWAQLLASGVEADEHQHPMWVRVLGQMSGEDARAFRDACDLADGVGAAGGVRSEDRNDAPTTHPAIARMQALGILVPGSRFPFPYWKRVLDLGGDAPSVKSALPTPVGAQFRRAVMPRAAKLAAAPTPPAAASTDQKPPAAPGARRCEMAKPTNEPVVACEKCSEPMKPMRRLLPEELADPVAGQIDYDPAAGHPTTAGAVGRVRTDEVWKWRCPGGHERDIPGPVPAR